MLNVVLLIVVAPSPHFIPLILKQLSTRILVQYYDNFAIFRAKKVTLPIFRYSPTYSPYPYKFRPQPYQQLLLLTFSCCPQIQVPPSDTIFQVRLGGTLLSGSTPFSCYHLQVVPSGDIPTGSPPLGPTFLCPIPHLIILSSLG